MKMSKWMSVWMPVAVSVLTVSCSGGGGEPPSTAAFSAQDYLTWCAWERMCQGGGAATCIEGMFHDDYFQMPVYPESAIVLQRRDCLAAASDCNAYWDCLQAEPETTCDTPGARCDGNTAIWCSPTGTETRMDCAQYQARCEQKQDDPGGVGCVLDEPVSRCVGDETLVSFEERGSDGDIFWVLDCAVGGWICDSEFGCISPERKACTKTVCEGSVIAECRRNQEEGGEGRVVRNDCTRVAPNAVCWLEEGEQGRCGLPPEQRTCEEGARCDGNTLRRCTYGIEIALDCSRFGATCVSQPQDSDDDADCELPTAEP